MPIAFVPLPITSVSIVGNHVRIVANHILIVGNHVRIIIGNHVVSITSNLACMVLVLVRTASETVRVRQYAGHFRARCVRCQPIVGPARRPL